MRGQYPVGRGAYLHLLVSVGHAVNGESAWVTILQPTATNGEEEGGELGELGERRECLLRGTGGREAQHLKHVEYAARGARGRVGGDEWWE